MHVVQGTGQTEAANKQTLVEPDTRPSVFHTQKHCTAGRILHGRNPLAAADSPRRIVLDGRNQIVDILLVVHPLRKKT